MESLKAKTHHVGDFVTGHGLAGVARPAVQVVRLVLLHLAQLLYKHMQD